MTVGSSSVLDVQQLSFAYPDQVATLRDISFSVSRGERIGLIGPNGAGKSSLFMNLSGVLTPTAGQIELMGSLLKPGAFNPAVALVFQQADDQLFSPTVWEDVAFGARNMGFEGRDLNSVVSSALKTVGITDLAKRPVHQLSGGEKRLTCLAGSLVMQPQLMLLDEPSAALDIRNRRRLINLLSETQLAMLIASHDLELIIELCPRVILLDNGSIIADGLAKDILSNRTLMERHGQEVPFSLRC